MSDNYIQMALRAELLETFDDPEYEPPPLPSIAFELLQLSSKPNVDIRQIVALLERDELLAATVMRLVSSPLYSGRRPIQSLMDAVVRLGINIVRDIVFQAALGRGVFKGGVYTEAMERVGRHSTVTGYLTRSICRTAGISADYGFLAGLLHDIGFAALLLAILNKEGNEPPPLESLWADIDALHVHASETIARLWRLPEEITLVITHHHDSAPDDVHGVKAAVVLADALSSRFDAGLEMLAPTITPAIDRVPAANAELARAALHLDDAAMSRVDALATETLKGLGLLPGDWSL